MIAHNTAFLLGIIDYRKRTVQTGKSIVRIRQIGIRDKFCITIGKRALKLVPVI